MQVIFILELVLQRLFYGLMQVQIWKIVSTNLSSGQMLEGLQKWDNLSEVGALAAEDGETKGQSISEVGLK